MTGAAGFIGFHLAKRLINLDYNICGLDNLDDYYDVKLKKERLSKLTEIGLVFKKIDVSKKEIFEKFLFENNFDIIIHLAGENRPKETQDFEKVLLM